MTVSFLFRFHQATQPFRDQPGRCCLKARCLPVNWATPRLLLVDPHMHRTVLTDTAMSPKSKSRDKHPCFWFKKIDLNYPIALYPLFIPSKQTHNGCTPLCFRVNKYLAHPRRVPRPRAGKCRVSRSYPRTALTSGEGSKKSEDVLTNMARSGWNNFKKSLSYIKIILYTKLEKFKRKKLRKKKKRCPPFLLLLFFLSNLLGTPNESLLHAGTTSFCTSSLGWKNTNKRRPEIKCTLRYMLKNIQKYYV